MGEQDSWASSPERRRIMQAIRGRDTAPELALRRLLHARGLRYRVDSPPLPGVRRRADLVFGPARVAVFVDGCFWHRCPEHATEPRTNTDYWAPKLDRNVERDRETDALLTRAGWVSVRVWEHEDPAVAARRVARIVRRRRARLQATRT
ncbi:MAG: very short patch repair endonuclease [Candidatus Nanopelagicales bacterium]